MYYTKFVFFIIYFADSYEAALEKIEEVQNLSDAGCSYEAQLTARTRAQGSQRIELKKKKAAEEDSRKAADLAAIESARKLAKSGKRSKKVAALKRPAEAAAGPSHALWSPPKVMKKSLAGPSAASVDFSSDVSFDDDDNNGLDWSPMAFFGKCNDVWPFTLN